MRLRLVLKFDYTYLLSLFCYMFLRLVSTFKLYLFSGSELVESTNCIIDGLKCTYNVV